MKISHIRAVTACVLASQITVLAADADPLEHASRTQVLEFMSENIECGAFFDLAKQSLEQSSSATDAGDRKSVQKLTEVVHAENDLIEMLASRAGLTSKETNDQMIAGARQMVRLWQQDQKRTTQRYSSFCESLTNHPGKRLTEIINGRVCGTGYPCK